MKAKRECRIKNLLYKHKQNFTRRTEKYAGINIASFSL